MSDSQALTPVEQRTVLFYDDELTAVLVDEDQGRIIYIPIRPITEYLGLNWSGQQQRVRRDPVLSEAVRIVCVTHTNPEGGNPNVLCLPLKFIPGWLFGIAANRVKKELRDKIIRYQRECYDVLAEAFREGRLTNDPAFSELLKRDTPAVQAYKNALAIVEIARNQVILEARVDDHENRLETIEALLGDDTRYVSKAQATQISQAVKAVALIMSKQTRKNEFGGVYGELYRRFQVPSYREVPAARYDQVMRFLREWYQSLTDDEVPF